jgi:hypothetical protein
VVKYSSDIDKVVLRKLRSNFSKVNLIAVLRSSGSLVGNGLVNVSGVRFFVVVLASSKCDVETESGFCGE